MIAKTLFPDRLARLSALATTVIACYTATPAHAFTYPSISSTLLMGIRQPNVAAEIIVNLGPASKYVSLPAGTTITVTNCGTATLTAAFYNLDDVRWSVFGCTNIGNGPAATSITWVSSPRASADTQTTPWKRKSNSLLRAVNALMDSVGTTAQTYSGDKPVDSIKNNPVVVINLKDLRTDWGYYAYVNDRSGDEGNSGNFQTKWQGIVEATMVSGVAICRSDLYQVDSIATGTADATYLGYFDMHADGTITYTAASGAVAPAAPAAVTAVATNGAIIVGWSASSGATNYNVKRSLSSDGVFTNIGSVSGTNYSDTTVVGGTTYYYVVTAVGSGVESSSSSPVVTATAKIIAPPAQFKLMATAGKMISFFSESGVTYILLSTNSAGLTTPLAQWPQVNSLTATNGVVSFNVAGYTNAFFTVRASRP